MKVGFIGLGRMGEVGVYNRTAEKAKPLIEAGGKLMGSVAAAANFGGVVFSMVSDDAAALEVGAILKQALPQGGIHVCAGTHSVAAIEQLTALHGDAGQVLLATPVLGRPDVVANGNATMLVGGAPQAVERCRPFIAAIAGRIVESGSEPVSAAAIKIAHNFVLGCAIESLGEGFSLTRKYGVAPDVFYRVLAEGLFNCWVYKTYGKFIADERYLPAGQRAVNGLKDANLALAAGEAKGVPLPSGNVWRDRLVGAVAHGEGEHDWAVMAKDQARASGLVK